MQNSLNRSNSIIVLYTFALTIHVFTVMHTTAVLHQQTQSSFPLKINQIKSADLFDITMYYENMKITGWKMIPFHQKRLIRNFFGKKCQQNFGSQTPGEKLLLKWIWNKCIFIYNSNTNHGSVFDVVSWF